MKKLLVSALEASANLHLEPIVDNMNDCELLGIFDLRFGKPILSSNEFSVMGFSDILSKIAKAKKAIKKMTKLSLEAEHVLLIDSPAFNLPLAKAIRKINKDIPITWYILPKVWAWRKKRAAEIEKHCTNLASIFPFEDRFFTRSIYVGNPLLDEIKKIKKSLSKSGKIVFMPGSRKSEIKALINIFKDTAKRLNKESIVVIPKHFSKNDIELLYGDLSGFTISRNAYDSLYEAEFAYICSGTATLEAALIGTPFVLCYKAGGFDFFIAKRFVKLKYVGLANIIFDFYDEPPLHVELLQENVNVQNLLSEYENIDKESFFRRSKKLEKILKHGSSEIMAKLVYN
jgi:lipid-A-disaccharide synthase